MIVFNIFAVAQLFIALIPAAIVGGLASLAGFDGGSLGPMAGAVLLFPLDILMRLAMGGGGEDGESQGPNTILRLILPGSGGHVFFLPTWLWGLAVVPLSCLGVFL